jgi:hypothetical protein
MRQRSGNVSSRISLPIVVPDREPLTELEARQIGDSAYRLAKLRQMRGCPGPFDLSAYEHSIAAYGSSPSRMNHRLTKLEAEAILALLIERETLFLASFNVAIENV